MCINILSFLLTTCLTRCVQHWQLLEDGCDLQSKLVALEPNMQLVGNELAGNFNVRLPRWCWQVTSVCVSNQSHTTAGFISLFTTTYFGCNCEPSSFNVYKRPDDRPQVESKHVTANKLIKCADVYDSWCTCETHV